MPIFQPHRPVPIRSVAILTGPSTHLDHLGVLSSLLTIPLIVTEEKTFELAKRYYPQIDIHLMELADLSIDFLCNRFDVIFQSGKFWTLELKPLMELFFRKSMRFVFCPHGNSDKGHSLKEHPQQDISLVYGDHLQDHLKKTGALNGIHSTIATGNYRYLFYRQHKNFYDEIVEKEIFSRFKEKRKTLLYAPTWGDQENPTSFFEETEQLIIQLKSSYHLIIKLHPFLIEDHLPEVLSVQNRYEGDRAIQFVDDFPAIYPLLNRCDIYLGDYSSIGYDFLTFDRPLYFFRSNEDEDPYTDFAACGVKIPSSERNDLGQFFEKTLNSVQDALSLKRQRMYAYAFGKEKKMEVLQREIFQEI